MERVIYFDHSATTRLDSRVFSKMQPFLSYYYGNPSSMYFLARKSKKAIEEAREKVAYCLNAKPQEIYFTSCGSESDNLALKGVMYADKGMHLITSKIEHPAILNTCATLERQGFEVTYLNVDAKGCIYLDELERAIRQDTVLISIMFANNEIGTIEPIAKIGKIAKERGVYFHTDAVQAVGNVRINVEELGIDLLSLSAHKFYGPKGVGALYVRESVPFERLQDGGHQEKGKRSGTENVAGIVGLAEAMQYAYQEMEYQNKKTSYLRKYFMEKLLQMNQHIQINGDLENRLPGNINATFPGFDGQEFLLQLEEYGICVSTGSACSSGEGKPSHVLTAIGLTKEQAERSLRFTLGRENTRQEIDYACKIINQICKKTQKMV